MSSHKISSMTWLIAVFIFFMLLTQLPSTAWSSPTATTKNFILTVNINSTYSREIPVQIVQTATEETDDWKLCLNNLKVAESEKDRVAQDFKKVLELAQEQFTEDEMGCLTQRFSEAVELSTEAEGSTHQPINLNARVLMHGQQHYLFQYPAGTEAIPNDKFWSIGPITRPIPVYIPGLTNYLIPPDTVLVNELPSTDGLVCLLETKKLTFYATYTVYMDQKCGLTVNLLELTGRLNEQSHIDFKLADDGEIRKRADAEAENI